MGNNVSNTDSLWRICENLYFPQNLRIQSWKTRNQYRFACNFFGEYLGRIGTIDDLRKPVLIGFLRWLNDEKGLAPKTCNERVGRLKTLWQWLAEEELLDRIPPKNIRLQEPESTPTAWTIDELTTLYRSAGAMPGQICGIPAGSWWQAWLLWLWNTGARCGESFALEWSHVRDNGLVVVPADVRKGRKKTAYYRLWQETYEMMLGIRTELPNVFPWAGCIGSYYHSWKVLLRIAGLPNGRKRKTQSMRVSHATWITIRGGDASSSLMHSDPATTRKHYIDSQMVAENKPDLRLPRIA